jgi:hypothetical protein
VTKSNIVSVGEGEDALSCGVGNNRPCGSIDYAIYSSLNMTSVNKTINLVGDCTVKNNVEITGITVGSENAMQNVKVPKGLTMLVNYSAGVSGNTSLKLVSFMLSSSVMVSSFLQVVSSSASASLSLLNVSFQFYSPLRLPLLSVSGLSTFLMYNISVVKVR